MSTKHFGFLCALTVFLSAFSFTSKAVAAEPVWTIDVQFLKQPGNPGDTLEFRGSITPGAGKELKILNMGVRWDRDRLISGLKARPSDELLAQRLVIPPSGYTGPLFHVEIPKTATRPVKAYGFFSLQVVLTLPGVRPGLIDSEAPLTIPFSIEPPGEDQPPTMKIEINKQQIRISWPGPGFTIEAADTIAPGARWENLATTTTAEGGVNTLTIATDRPGRYFRLRKK